MTLGRVMVVEDNDDVLRVSSDILHTAGFTVIECRSAEEAVTKVHDAEVVFLGLDLPGMSGEELVAWLRARGNYIPIVIVSAWEDRAYDLKHVRSYDIVHILTKPVPPEKLIEKAKAGIQISREIQYISEASTKIKGFMERETMRKER